MKTKSARVQALRQTAKFLYCVAKGAPLTPEEAKIFSDLCWLAVPMKNRMTKEEIAQIDARPWEPAESSVNISMTQERFGELVKGPLYHPDRTMMITRLTLALYAVLAATGKAGSDAFEGHCKQRVELDKLDNLEQIDALKKRGNA